MPIQTFTTDDTKTFGIEAKCDAGYRVMGYRTVSGAALGGGTLRILTQPQGGGAPVPLADSKLTASTLDDNGDAVQQVTFISAGNVYVQLSGSSGSFSCEVFVV